MADEVVEDLILSVAVVAKVETSFANSLSIERVSVSRQSSSDDEAVIGSVEVANGDVARFYRFLGLFGVNGSELGVGVISPIGRFGQAC